MRPRSFAIALACAASAGFGLLASCRDSAKVVAPTGPTPTVKRLSGLSISGPTSVAPGATVQLAAVASYADGSTENVTSATMWFSRSSLLSVSSSGAATGLQAGEVDVLANYRPSSGETRIATFPMLVIPTGTYRLTGTVLEFGLPVRGATVDVTAGQGTGLSATSDTSGGYKLYGVAGDVVVRARKEAYVSQSRALTVADNAVADFQLTTVNPEPNVAGTYQLTVTVGSDCQHGSVPDELRQRRYTAVITQDAQRLGVTLSGANFAVKGGVGNRFSGRVEPDRVTFHISGFDDYYSYYLSAPYEVVETLDNGRFLIMGGDVTTTRSGANLVGTLNGSIAVATLETTGYRAVNECSHATDQFTLTRDSAAATRTRSRR